MEPSTEFQQQPTVDASKSSAKQQSMTEEEVKESTEWVPIDSYEYYTHRYEVWTPFIYHFVGAGFIVDFKQQ